MPDPVPSVDDYVARIVAEWPPLSEAQRQRLEQLLARTDRTPVRGRSATQ